MSDDQRPEDLRALLQELARASDAGDSSGVADLTARMHALAHARLGRGDRLRLALDSEDLAQSALFDLVRNVHYFRGTTWAEFFAFADKVLQRRRADLARHLNRRRRNGDIADLDVREQAAPEPSVPRAETAEHAARARALVGELPSSLRAPLELRLAGMDYEVIGERLGLTSVTVRKRVSRALSELRRRWGGV